MLKIALVLGSAILLCSCTNTNTNYYPNTLQSWHGGNSSMLIKRWGKPDQILQGPKGTTLYVYKTEAYHAGNLASAPAVGVTYSAHGNPVFTSSSIENLNQNGGRNVALLCTTIFEINSRGKILRAKSQGNGCYGSAKFAASMNNPKGSM